VENDRALDDLESTMKGVLDATKAWTCNGSSNP
jgi:hypothetical protein